MLNHRVSIALTCALLVAASGCGDAQVSTSGPPATDAPASEDEFLGLKPPSIERPPSAAQPLGEMVSFVSCEEADEHVGGALRSSAALVTADTERACYVEILEGETIRYAGALIVPRGSDVKSVTILDVIRDGGIAVTISTGVEKTESLTGSDLDAPGGGYAEFALGSSDPGRVVRVESDRTQAMYEFALADGTMVRAEVTSNGTPKDVVAMAQTVFEDSRSG